MLYCKFIVIILTIIVVMIAIMIMITTMIIVIIIIVTILYRYILMRISWGILVIYVSITRVIVNKICGLCRGFANKVLMVQWGCNHQNTYFGSLLHTKIFERNLHLQKDSQNIWARSPSRNSQDFATRILQRNSQTQYPISLIRNPQELDTRSLQGNL